MQLDKKNLPRRTEKEKGKTNSTRFVFSNGVVSYSSDAPPVTTFLESLPVTSSFKWESRIRWMVNSSMNQVLPIALKERPYGEELAVTALVCGDLERLKEMKDVADDDDDGVLKVLDVHLHIESYVPPVFGLEENGAHLALMGPGRDVASAKYSAWPLDKLRPPLVTELLLSNYGDRILEGCITNFFVICQRDKNDAEGKYQHDYDGGYSIEVQTSPITDDVLPGVIRQPSMPEQGHPSAGRCTIMGKAGIWEEAFITNSLRVLRHVETIKVPHSWESFKSKCLNGILWMEKKFEGPGMITKIIQVKYDEQTRKRSWREPARKGSQ
ncbi:hypothetical protein PTKIN_Ptkin16aG0477200 [Pterospermum kingtungense]